jgi:hypothetical protein
MSTLRSASFVVIAALATACVAQGDDVEVGDDETPTGEVEQGILKPCDGYVCGANSPCMSTGTPCDKYFYELPTMIGSVNPEGFKLLGMKVGMQDYNLSVVNGELRGVKAGWPPVIGLQLVNKLIRVLGPDGTTFVIKIKSVTTTNLYPFGSGSTPAYEFVYYIEGNDQYQRNVCSAPETLTGEYDTLFQNKWTAVVFEGPETYKAATKTIRTPAISGLFNVGCAGHILAKMHLTHHSAVTGVGAYATTPAQRQAFMKMLSADYCGDGTAFTVAGQPLSWADDLGYLPHYYPAATLEARWTKDGPLCLEKPRLKGTADPYAISLFGPDIDIAINAHCGATRPKKCSALGQSLDINKFYGAHLVSANP